MGEKAVLLAIHLLGTFEVILDEEPLGSFKSVKVCALLAYLAAEAGHPQARGILAGLLWPGYPQASANQSLRQALYSLRKALGDSDWLEADRQAIMLVPGEDCRVDVLELEQALSTARAALTDDGRPQTAGEAVHGLRSAVEAYRGPFLEGFSLPDSPEFEVWILSKRQHYHREMLTVLSRLAAYHERSGDYGQGLAYAREQLALEPWLEEAHRQVMRLLALTGRRSEALAQFEDVRVILRDELNAGPSQETLDLVEKIRTGEIGKAPEGDGGNRSLASRQYESYGEEFYLHSSKVRHPHNLPLERTSFIGRETEVARVKELLSQNRMVTLTGVGGTGKTRLSLHVAGLVLEDYPNGAWLVELAGLSDPAMVPRTAASALNLPEIAGKPVTESLVNFLREKRLLLVLDNCEHLLQACIDLADRLLLACPDLTILASSREFLGVTGEAPYRLPPMALPDARQGTDAVLLAAYDAVKLFTERARVVFPDFAVTADNAPAVVQVMGRLDGIPLAIELAAARLRLLSVAQVAQRLDDAFRLLTGGSRSALPRHQTLRASIDWSYNLLSEPERILLRRLSVFAGSWRLSAAERVCADPSGPEAAIHPDEVLDLVTGLLDKSLIQTVHTSDGTNRFRMLETIRQYAHEKLVDEGESEAARDRHLAYYLEWVEETAPKIRGPEQVQTMDRLERELDDLRQALDWALRTDIEAQLKMTADLLWFWNNRSHEAEGINWLKRGLEGFEIDQDPIELVRVEIDPMVYARALTVLGRFRWFQLFSISSQVDYAPEQGKILLEKAVSIYQALNPDQNQDAKLGLAWANVWLGYFILEDEPERALAMAEDSMRIFRAAGDLIGMSECIRLMADRGSSTDDPLIQDQLAISEKMGDPTSIAYIYNVMWMNAARKGDYASGSEFVKLYSEYAQRTNDPIKVHRSSLVTGINLLYLGDLESAEENIQRALDGFRDIGHETHMIWTLDAIFRVQIAQGHFDQASDVIDQAWKITQRSGNSSFVAFTLILRARLARLLGDTELALNHLNALPPIMDIPYYQKISIPLEWGNLALQTGDLEQAGRRYLEGLTIIHSSYLLYVPPFFDGVALYAARKGEIEAAARLFGSRWCRAYTHFLSPIEREWREGDWAAMIAGLGDERFKALYKEGQSLTYKQAVTLAQELLEK